MIKEFFDTLSFEAAAVIAALIAVGVVALFLLINI